MRPNTPHVVFTSESSSCLGGHFIATTTLLDTCYGIFHSFVAGDLVTNANHTVHVFMLLARMISFYENELIIGAYGDEIEEDLHLMTVDPGRFISISSLQIYSYLIQAMTAPYTTSPTFRRLTAFSTSAPCLPSWSWPMC
jgi:hypothetical protein